MGVDAWYRADAVRLQRYVRREVANRGVPSSTMDPQDVVHEAFEQLQQKLDKVKSPAAWLRTVAERIVARAHHAQRYVASREVGDYLADSQIPQWTSLIQPAADIWNYIAVKMVMSAIAALPDRQRAAVYLAKVEGMAEAEIAERLDIACSTVGVHVHRALRKLRAELGEMREWTHTTGTASLSPMSDPRRYLLHWTWCPCWGDTPRGRRVKTAVEQIADLMKLTETKPPG